MKNILLILALFFACCSNDNAGPSPSSSSEGGGSVSYNGPVPYYGKLQASGSSIIGSKTGKPAQLRGVSFGWSNVNWESGRFYREVAVDAMARDWKAEVVRAAYGETGLAFSNSTARDNRTNIEIIADAAIANDIYVIIDWHSHNAHSEAETKNSKDFFEYMAQKYGNNDNVIFEIYNEPISANNGTWANVKNYAEQIIPVIRQYSSNLILVGTPQWCQRVDNVVGNAINDNNVGYVFHFYAASHSFGTYGGYVNTALNAGLPIFVTEYGSVNSDGGLSDKGHYDTHNAQATDEWHNFMDSKKISSAAWQISDKYEGSAFFGINGAARKFDMQSWTDKSKMTAEGKYVFDKLNEYSKSAPWRTN